jgi:hypothetical protein
MSGILLSKLVFYIHMCVSASILLVCYKLPHQLKSWIHYSKVELLRCTFKFNLRSLGF